ncbi:MAG: trigger factor [Pseudomonadota bacterium]
MQVAVEVKDGLERIITVGLPADDLQKEVQSRLQNLSRTTKLNGFRPGKIPFSVIKQRFGEQVNAEVLNKKVQETFYQAVSQEKLRPAGLPEIEQVKDDNKDVISYTAKFEIYPEFEVATIEGSKFEKPIVNIADADIDSTVDNIRKQQQHFHSVEREVQKDDRVTINFSGTIDGENFEGNEGKEVPLVIGSKQMIDGFEDGLTGAKAGDDLTLNLNFPEEYHFEKVAGKAVEFKVALVKVEEPHLPELNDEFFKLFGVTEGGEDAFRAEVKKNMEVELEKNTSAKMKNSVMERVLELNQFDIPKALIQDEAKSIAEQMKKQYQVQGNNLEQDLSLFEGEAKKRVSLGLILAELVKKNDIKVSDDELKDKISKMAQSYENPQEVINYYLNDQQRKMEMESVVLEEKVVDWAFDQGNVNEKKYSFTEFMSPQGK